jgi:hypothetical protein
VTKLTRLLDALAGSLAGGAIEAAVVVSSLAPRTLTTAFRAMRDGA